MLHCSICVILKLCGAQCTSVALGDGAFWVPCNAGFFFFGALQRAVPVLRRLRRLTSVACIHHISVKVPSQALSQRFWT